jgi:bacillithiol system protein YtxJ
MTSYETVENRPEAIEALVAASLQEKILIFKHSLTCEISMAAFEELERYLAERPPGGPRVALIKIQQARDASNEVARRTGVKHESPQALVLRDGKVAWHASHFSITARALADHA